MSDQVDQAPPEKRPKKPLKCRFHGGFADWLKGCGGSLAISTYTAGKVVLAFPKQDRVGIDSYKLPRPLGMARNGRRLAIAVRENILTFRLAESSDHDASLFQSEQCFATGKVNAHDLAYGRRGILFANTRFNCLARVSEKRHFTRCWLPPFISDLVPQDRCHLNGIGMQQGQAAMVTAFCETDSKNDWRKEDRFTSGVMIDVRTKEIVARGLCMPHSPRRYRGKWWLCDSGRGSLSVFDEGREACHEVTALPGFTRGLGFVGDHALVGLSKIRPKHILDAPPVRERFGELLAGVALVNIKTGMQTGMLEFVEGGNEVFEVTFLRGIVRPRLEISFNERLDSGTP